MNFDVKQCLKRVRLPDATWFGLREVTDKRKTLFVRNGHPEACDDSTSHGVMVEALVDGCFGYAATHILTVESVQAAAEKAAALARASAKFMLHRFTEKERPCAIGEYKTPVKKPFDAASLESIYSLLLKTNNALKVTDAVVKRDCLAALVETETRFVSSNGSDVWQNVNIAMSQMIAIAKQGSQVQKRSRNGNSAHSFQMGLELFDEMEFLQAAERVGREAVELLSAEECPTLATDLVLAPDQMMLQIHESIGHPLELDRVLGDERNYAGFSFVRPKDFGKLQYGSKVMNVTFDPTVPHEIASYGFDDCGNKATKQYLIKDGVLVAGLGSLESQARSGIPGVANFRACSWNRAPIDRMSNINLEPGSDSIESIISSIENGVYMETNKSWSIDDYRNKFQFGCEYARRIQNGRLTTTLRNPNYRGRTSEFWHNLWKVGDAKSFTVYGTPNCGKGEPNQLIRVGHASPACAFRGVEVFGGN